jgi:hypothetical protein
MAHIRRAATHGTPRCLCRSCVCMRVHPCVFCCADHGGPRSQFKAPAVWQHTLLRYAAIFVGALCFLFAALAMASDEWFLEKYDGDLKASLGVYNICLSDARVCDSGE